MKSHLRLARLLWALCALACIALSGAQAATLTTDREDYAPFSSVQITGAGFEPGEMVTNQVVQVEGPLAGLAYDAWGVTADSNGGFITTWYVFTQDLLGTTLQLTATGQSSGLTATVIFSDSLPPAPVSVPVGGFGIDGDLQANTPIVGIFEVTSK